MAVNQNFLEWQLKSKNFRNFRALRTEKMMPVPPATSTLLRKGFYCKPLPKAWTVKSSICSLNNQ